MLVEYVPLKLTSFHQEKGVNDHVVEPSAYFLQAVDFSGKMHEDHLKNLERLREFSRNGLDLSTYFALNHIQTELLLTSCDMTTFTSFSDDLRVPEIIS